MTAAYPGVPSRNRTSVDAARLQDKNINELRKAMFGVVRSADSVENQVIGPDLSGAGWGLARPHLGVSVNPVTPDIGIPGYTFVVAYRAVFKPESQQLNLGVAYSTVEPTTPAGTCVGEYEVRWNKGTQPGPRGENLTDSILIDSWDSGTPGPKGNDGSLQRSITFVYPQDGSGPLVSYGDGTFVCISVWSRIRTATGLATDIAKVVPVWCYQSGYQDG